MDNKSILIVWAHECFTPTCKEISVVAREVETHDSAVEVPNMYCTRSRNQLRLVQIDGVRVGV